jgi:prevent-host-death family protein
MTQSKPHTVGVADLKRQFSEYLDRVVHARERVLVRRRGKQVAALVPVEEVAPPRPTGHGLAAAAGAWAEHPDIDGFVEAVRRARRGSRDRSVEPL